jgi:hypothetical protein
MKVCDCNAPQIKPILDVGVREVTQLLSALKWDQWAGAVHHGLWDGLQNDGR